jgi:hypothetical protein
MLIGLTAAYVVYTNMLVQENRRANQQNREAVEKQFRLLTSAHLFCEVRSDGPDVVLAIYNTGNLPALDISVHVAGHYYAGDIDVPTFLATYVAREHRSKINLQGKDIYGVQHQSSFYRLQARKKRCLRLGFPTAPIGINILLQYRDVLGINYGQHFTFFDRLAQPPEEGNDREFYLDSADPIVAAPIQRVRGWLGDEIKSENEMPLPEFIRKEFVPVWEDSIPSGYVSKPSAQSE